MYNNYRVKSLYMKIKVELLNRATGKLAIADVEIPEDSVNLDRLLASIPESYEYCHYWVVELPEPPICRLRY